MLNVGQDEVVSRYNTELLHILYSEKHYFKEVTCFLFLSSVISIIITTLMSLLISFQKNIIKMYSPETKVVLKDGSLTKQSSNADDFGHDVFLKSFVELEIRRYSTLTVLPISFTNTFKTS